MVASNFSLFYTYAKARLNLPPKKRRVAFSHALTSMHNQRSQEGPENSTHANFTSLCSERQTERSFPSEISISCSITPRGSLKKSSFWSLRSMTKLLRPNRRANVSRSKSLNSVLSDYKLMKEVPVEGITLKFEPPSRVPSAADITKDQPEGIYRYSLYLLFIDTACKILQASLSNEASNCIKTWEQILSTLPQNEVYRNEASLICCMPFNEMIDYVSQQDTKSRQLHSGG